MDGALQWIMWNAIVVARSIGHKFSGGDMFAMVIVGTLLSMGAAPVPASGFGGFVVLLIAVNVAITEVVLALLGVLLAGFWAVDRSVTMTNIMGDAMGAGA